MIYIQYIGIKEPNYGYQICKTNQILICGGYVKVRESLYTWLIIWVNTIPNYIDTLMIFPNRYEGFLQR